MVGTVLQEKERCDSFSNRLPGPQMVLGIRWDEATIRKDPGFRRWAALGVPSAVLQLTHTSEMTVLRSIYYKCVAELLQSTVTVWPPYVTYSCQFNHNIFSYGLTGSYGICCKHQRQLNGYREPWQSLYQHKALECLISHCHVTAGLLLLCVLEVSVNICLAAVCLLNALPVWHGALLEQSGLFVSP